MNGRPPTEEERLALEEELQKQGKSSLEPVYALTPGALFSDAFIRQISGMSPRLGIITALAPTAKNLPIFMKRLMEKLPKQPTGLQKAIAFMQTRYPRFAQQVPIEISEGLPPHRAQYEPRGYRFYSEPKVAVSDYEAKHGDPREMSGVVGHEMMHARDYPRRPELFEGYPKIMGRGYTPEERLQYLAVPGEIRAGRAGFTSKRAWDKLQALLEQMYGR